MHSPTQNVKLYHTALDAAEKQVMIRILTVAACLARAACDSFVLVQVCMAVIEAVAGAVMNSVIAKRRIWNIRSKRQILYGT